MTEVFIICEGQTEWTFVKEVLYGHLLSRGVLVLPELTGARRTRAAQTGGHHGTWQPIRRDIEATLKRHSAGQHWVTTMLDLYRLPTDTPGFVTSESVRDPYVRVGQIEKAMGEAVDHQRFVPYVQLHEFEALLLADPDRIAEYYPSRSEAIRALASDVGSYPGPEWVDDGETTAPSKRIAARVPEYEKVLAGSVIALRVGLARIVEQCPHFAQWLGKLEALGQT